MSDETEDVPAILSIRDMSINDDLPPLELKTQRSNHFALRG